MKNSFVCKALVSTLAVLLLARPGTHLAYAQQTVRATDAVQTTSDGTALPPKPTGEKPPSEDKAEGKGKNDPAVLSQSVGPSRTVKIIGVLGASVVAAGAGTFLGVKAMGANSDYEAMPTSDGLSETRSYAAFSTAAFIVAGTLAVGALLAWIAPNDAPAKAKPKAASPGALFRF